MKCGVPINTPFDHQKSAFGTILAQGGFLVASIRKRGKAWRVQVRRRGFPALTASFTTKAEALYWARDKERAIDRGDCQPAVHRRDDVTVAELLRRYERTVSAQKRGAERESYKIRVLLRSPMSLLPISSVTSTMIAAYRDQRLVAVKPGTVRRELALLRHCFEIARREWGIPISKNPFTDVKLPSPSNSRERRLENEDQQELQAALKGRVWYLAPMMELAVETGMRRGELLGLLWQNIDTTKRLAILPMTKNGRSRKVPLTGRAVEVLTGLPVMDQRVFPISPGAFRRSWERLISAAGVQNLTFHDLRHEAISRFFEMGLSVPEVALISGHRPYRMLFRYTHIKAADIVKKLR